MNTDGVPRGFDMKSFLVRHLGAFVVLAAPASALGIAAFLMSQTNLNANSVFNVRSWPAVDDGVVGAFVLHGLLFSSIILVFFNTLAYGVDAWKKREGTAIGLYTVALLIIVAWLTEVCLGWGTHFFIVRGSDFANHLQDIYALAIFILFSLMDLLLYQKTRRDGHTTQECDGDSHPHAEIFLLQLLTVDLPVVCGILAVNVFLHEALERSSALGTGDGASGFIVGLGSGALLMQLALSQFVFLMIYTRYYFAKNDMPLTGVTQ